ncbi:MAG: serine/threonine-protein kinase [Nevskiales bacterium]|nr:serine/threonine-protein kinase [Nevskiales bacterium]
MTQAPSAALPAHIGKYTVTGVLGRGACGIVYRGYDPLVARDVAIKVALDERGGPLAQRGEQAFFAEARAAGMLQHPHIVSVFDAGVDAGRGYIVMEYIDGQPLSARGSQSLPFDQVLDIGFKCARALGYAHARGVLHRDIKPGNIMLTRDGVPKLMDFSIAQLRDDSATDRVVVGTPLYMSPEQIRRDRLTPASDLYSLGTVLFELTAGVPPFADAALPALFQAIRHQAPPQLTTLRPDTPPEFSAIVDRLLRKDPEQRYPSGEALATVLSREFDRLRLSAAQLTRRESRDSLRRLHFFNGFSDAEIDEILNASSLATYGRGDAIIREGEIDDCFFILARGEAEVCKGDVRIHQLGKGDCFGEVGFLGANRRSATVTALTDVLALKINRSLMDQLSPDAQLHFYKAFAETLLYRLSLTTAKLSASGRGSATPA